jgi:hypothetical protein
VKIRERQQRHSNMFRSFWFERAIIDRCISNRMSGQKKRREVGALDEGAEAFG